jgi:hypothetical protein
MNVRKQLALVVAGAALCGSLAAVAPVAVAAPAGSAAAGTTCEKKWKEIHLKNDAGSAKYLECDRTVSGHKQTSATLYLWDNKTDGKCTNAYVVTGTSHWSGIDSSWTHWYAWCSTAKHSPALRTGWHSGNDVEVTLQLR